MPKDVADIPTGTGLATSRRFPAPASLRAFGFAASDCVAPDDGGRPRLEIAVAEGVLALRLAGVGLIGLVVDAAILHIAIALGVAPAWARVLSLTSAMQVTFVINGLRVFRCLDRSTLVRQWAGYMASSGFGNFCNYWIFVTMVSTHWPVVSNPLIALCAGSLAAWLINYCGARFVVFGKPRAAGHKRAPG